MDVKNIIVAYGLVASGILSACRLGHNDDNMSITVVNTDDRFQFEASYNRKQTRVIERYITRNIQPNDVLNAADHANDIMVVMADKTIFRIKSYPGELKITLDKEKNSERGYNKVNELCRGIRDLLKSAAKKG